MASTDRLKRVSSAELDGLLDRARSEQWPQLVLLGPDLWFGTQVEGWPDSLKAEKRVFWLDAFIDELDSKLESLPSLTSLILMGNSIGDEGAKAIAAALPGLTSLDLSDNSIGVEGAKAIAASLQGLTSLGLGGNSIGDEGAKAIAAALPSLTSLDLAYNSVGEEGAKAIAAALPGLTSLNLGGNSIGVESAKTIAAALPGLTSLNLGGNSIGDEGAKAIAAALPGLTSLKLAYNSIGDEGAKAIAAALPSLTSLNLWGNSVGEEGAKAIAAALPGLTSLNLGGISIGAKRTKAIAAALPGLTSLDLGSLKWGGNSIGDEGAKAIAAALPSLTSLDLGNNSIGDEGAKAIAAALPGLTSLKLAYNSIGDEGAKAIAAALPSLTSLDLGNNSIGDEGAKAIAAALPGLTSLDLSDNSIGDEGAKAIAQSLTGLTSLNLSGNSIGDEGAKAIAQSLTSLTSLNLGYNSIGAEGAKALLDAWSIEQRIGQLRFLNLRENGDLGGLLPKEALETTDAQAILAAYRRFRRSQEEQTLRPLNELKLLVVGNEAVGKTSLLRYLIEGKPRDPNEKKTPGIAQHEKIEVQGWSPDDCQVQLNVWDFGGQEVMRGTHRYFLTERSLYLLVLEDRRQDDHRSISDWMKTIRNRAKDSPVIVVINKSDKGKQDLRPDEIKLREDYKNIATFLRSSTDPGDWAANSIKELRRTIVEVITKDERLKHVRNPIPANWLSIKSRVRDLADRRSVLPNTDFVALCKDPGDGTEPVSDENEQRALLRLLHDLGTIVSHGLERDAPAARREVTLLDPNWLTDAVYRILDQASSVHQSGEFLRHQLAEWLEPGPYPPERHEFILDMMQDPDIGLCFRLPIQKEERYLVPEALGASRPYLGKWPEDLLRFRFVYNYLPPGLIPRFIVQSNQNLTEEKSRWRTGVVLTACDCQVLVLADLDQLRIDIQVDGPGKLRRAALNVILNDLEAVHKLNPEAGPDARVPLPDRPEKDVSYKHLLMLEQRMGSNYAFIPDGAERTYQVGELLEGVRRDESKQPVKSDNPQQDTKSHVVILIHGIRTRALWQNELRKALEKEGFVVQPTNYEYFDLLRFLFPWQPFAGSVVNKIAKQISYAMDRNGVKSCSIIAHSFGTFVVARMLRDHDPLKFDKIIFCGSVLPQSFPIEKYGNRFKDNLVNEVGTRDFLPVFAEVVTFGYGSAGTYGLRRPAVRDRWHNGKAHSDFLNQDFCQKYWVPFLRDGTIIDNDEKAERPPFWLWAVSTFKIKYAVILMAAAAFLWALVSGLNVDLADLIFAWRGSHSLSPSVPSP